MAEEWNLPSGDLMKGKRGIVMGVANQNSIRGRTRRSRLSP